MQATLDRGWPLAMLIQIHQKAGHFGEGSISTSSHMNQAVEQENKDQNIHVIESEPQGIADQVGEKEDQNVHVIQPEPQGLADEGERIPRIVEAVQNEDQEARMMEECGDSSDDEDYPLLGEWRDKGFGNPVIQDIRSNEYEYRENEVVQGAKYPSIEAVKVM